MARMINSERKMNMGLNIVTMFKDGMEDAKFYSKDDVIQDLRYVLNKKVVTVSGRVVGFGYSLPNNVSWNADDPVDTLPTDIQVDSMIIDASEQYKSTIVTVPIREIVEFDGEENVARMRVEPVFTLDLKLYYSNNTSKEASIKVGDTYDNVVIMDPKNIGTDITGTFKVLSFGYSMSADRKLDFNKIALEDLNGNISVHDMDNIFDLNEIYSYEAGSGDIADVLALAAQLAPGDVLTISAPVDTTTSTTPIAIRADSTVKLDADVTAANSDNSGFTVANATVTFSGSGKIVSTTPYDSSHGTGVLNIGQGGKVIFNGSGINTVTADPENEGQFGIVYRNNGSVEVNDGDFKAGWYCFAGNGSSTTAESVVTINGGNIVSVGDYAIYHPHAGTLNINGGFILGRAGAIAVQAGTVNITGGTISSTGLAELSTQWNENEGTTGIGNAALNLYARYGDITCRISGGRFVAEGDAAIVVVGTAHNVDLKISGGEFSVKPDADWIEEGYYCRDAKNSAGFYQVVKQA